MKKYYSIALALLSTFYFAQEAISFELTEGFIMGVNIDGQNGWITTPTGGIPANVTNQIICTDKASIGSSSLNIVKETMYGTQTEPIIGAFYNLQAPLSLNGFSVSFDINMSQLNGSVFGFQGVNSAQEASVVRVDFDKTGVVKILDLVSGALNLIPTPGVFSPNTWYAFKVIGTASEVKYYLNDTLIYIGAAVSPLNIDQLRFVHDNALGSAYIDNIKINNGVVMAVKDSKINRNEVSVYPNPATDFIKIAGLHTIKEFEIYDVNGRKMKVELNGDTVDVRGFSSGVYLIKGRTAEAGFTEKLVKK
ncbi:MAG: T9SS type A sorting domain-containing protein [Chryseobacterium sp.]|uniref:T9SS type A sorting domain-containing protein n=1 Tax=Chryseobacterium sp. TaxID=1871047 RepID=UPI0025BAB338|nr:T9SS type A sorting domain-containing protein [Chryseobacterium sp.]MCJ7932097.1 T9SS type A sorting domain-containing protein [Chryseobacterium sp.]